MISNSDYYSIERNDPVFTDLDDIIEILENSDADFKQIMLENNSIDTNTPFVKILEQPAPKSLRFRYECEGRSTGRLMGITSTSEKKTYPSIQIVGFTGKAVVVVSCVTKDMPYRAHPYNLVGKEGCKKGVCTMLIPQDSMSIEFKNMAVQCVKRKDIEMSLKTRQDIRVDPFLAGFEHSNDPTSINLSVIRLCFQVFLADASGKPRIPLKAIVSDPIFDKKSMFDLSIKSLCSCSTSVAGGNRIILLCDKVNKDDIQVRFYEENGPNLIWEAYGNFTPSDVHFQTAIEFKTPQYKCLNVDSAIKVNIQLLRPSDGATSIPLPFLLTPMDTTRSKLWNLFRQYEQQESTVPTRLEKINEKVQEPVDNNEITDDNMSYSSIQMAYKNTVLEDQYDEVCIETNFNASNSTICKSNFDVTQAPPLPPKRYRKMSMTNGTGNGRKYGASCYSIALTESQADQIIKPKPVLRSVSLRSNRPKVAEKRPGFLKRIFSKKKLNSKSNLPSSLTLNNHNTLSTTTATVKSHQKYNGNAAPKLYNSKDLVIHIPLKDDNSVEEWPENENENDSNEMDLTEAENYALYMAIAPHATQSEFDEMSCLYAPVEHHN